MPDDGWNETQLATLVDMWARECFASEIANAVGKTRNAVIGKARRMSLARRNSSNNAGRPPERRERKPRTAPKVVRVLGDNKKRPRQAVIAESIGEPPPSSRGPVAIMGLTRRTCRWPLGMPAHDMLYCGNQIDGASVYCREHHRMAVDKVTRSRM